MEKSRSFRVRPEHKEVILEEAEKNFVLITKNFSKANARAHYNKSWSLLTARLNSLGYGDKSEDKWRRLFVDWISLTKSKYTEIKKDREKTGGGPPNNIQLNPQEERLMAMKGYSSVEENPTICETDSMPEDMQSTSHTNIHNDSIDQEDIIISVENMEPV
ncbi:unnamed protein product [Phaedon cochleariae]|uniref:Regulatory protein zeste n=1 Tax=Phaedon cochleariae TaxID=80249 RepID=A0A9N9SFH2_PHACE|nr:unnamed protein product [Phaedon cochleariae]